MEEKKNIDFKKKIGIAALVLTIAGAGLFGVTKANAATTDTTNPVSSLVQKIATKFGLNQSDVQAVFDQDHAEREAQRETEYETQLTQYVTEGKITQAQKDLILAKHKEIKASREADMQNMKNMTQEERKTAMEKKRTELESWAKQNNIDIQYVMPKFGRGMGHRGGPDMDGQNAQPTTSARPVTTTTQ